MQKLKMIASGRVQGVGFRYGSYQLAQKYLIKGRVWNEGNGTVVILAQSSDSQALTAFEREIRKGPTPWAKVKYLEVTTDNSPEFSDFRIGN